MLNMEPPAPWGCWGAAPPNWGAGAGEPKLGAGAANVGAGAAKVEPPVAPAPKGLALGAGALLLKLKAPPEAPAAGGL